MNKIIRKIFDLIVIFSNYQISLFFLNLRSFYHIKKRVFYYSKNYSKYYVKNKKNNFYILEKKRLNFYIRGFSDRIKNLKNEYLIDMITFKENDFIIDCGANIGEFRFCLPEKITYYGFEPGENEFSCLKININKKDKIFNCGLWNKSCILDFYVNSESADSSIIEPNKYYYKSKIKVKRLDEIEILHNKKIKLLKLEAEGCEPEVLSGTVSILKNIKYISADLGFERGVKKESTFESVNNFLLENNFKLIDKNSQRLVCIYQNLDY